MAKKNKKKNGGASNGSGEHAVSRDRLAGAEDLVEASELTENGETVVATSAAASAETKTVEFTGKVAEVLDRTSLNWHDPDDLTIIGLDTPHKRGQHPLWQKRATLPIDEGFVDDMVENGFHDPIMTRRDGKQVLVVDGRQRVKTAREANKRLREAGAEPIKISALPPQKGEDGDMIGLMIGLNEHRTEVDIIERARSVVDFMKYGRSEAQAATRLGVSVQVVKNMLKTLECDPMIIKAAEDGEVAPSVLMTLSELSREEQVAQFEKMREEGKLTVTEAQRAVRRKKNGHSEDEDRGTRISVTDVRKILKLAKKKELEADISEEVLATMQVWAGLIPPNRVRGLLGALRQVGALQE